jgi:type IV pilus assembly protein PilW
MTHRSYLHARSQSQGHTLPELLVGLSVGLIVVAAATTLLGMSRQSWFNMNAAESLHANARAALRALRTHAWLAGTVDVQATQVNQWQIVSPYTSAQPDLAGIQGNKSQRSITLSHSSAIDSRDCQGNHLNKQAVVRNDFKFNSSNEFSCKDLNESGSTYQALAEGVEDLQVRYAHANPATQTLQWKTADQVNDMSQVMAIEVCLRMARPTNVQTPKPSTPLKGCSDETIPHDGQLRRVFRRVYALRNHREVMP